MFISLHSLWFLTLVCVMHFVLQLKAEQFTWWREGRR